MDIKNDVVLRLKGFGYEVVSDDDAFIGYLISSVEQNLKNLTNLSTVPEGLHYEWVDAVCGEFLRAKLSTGKLENVGRLITSISEGDTSVSYSDKATPESQLLTCLDKLKINPSSVIRYRVMVW